MFVCVCVCVCEMQQLVHDRHWELTMMLVCVHHPSWGVNRSNWLNCCVCTRASFNAISMSTCTCANAPKLTIPLLTSWFKGRHDWLRIPTFGDRESNGPGERWETEKYKRRKKKLSSQRTSKANTRIVHYTASVVLCVAQWQCQRNKNI